MTDAASTHDHQPPAKRVRGMPTRSSTTAMTKINNQAMMTKWQHLVAFTDTNLKMLDNEDLCDVTLVAGNEQKQIRCHKFILASRSPVFYAMFCGALAESKDIIRIPDIEPSTLEDLLRYLYSGEFEITTVTVLSLLYAAKKYDIPGLESHCKSFMKGNIDAENVCPILDQAILFDDEEIKAKSLDFIMDKSEGVLKSDAFVRMSKSGLKEVLKLEQLYASECELYAACKRWASERCTDAGKQDTGENIRQELGEELIYLIRFPTMTFEEFTDVVASENVLTDSELLSVYRSISKKDIFSKFITKPRKFTSGNCLFVRCARISRGWAYNGSPDGISFTVSKDCELSAVDMFLPTTAGSVTGVVEILEGTTVIHSQNVTLNRNKAVKHLLVSLDTRLNLKSTNEYSVRQRMTGKSVFYCGSTNSNITMEGVTMTITDLKVGLSDNITSVSQGQFYGFELLINTKT